MKTQGRLYSDVNVINPLHGSDVSAALVEIVRFYVDLEVTYSLVFT